MFFRKKSEEGKPSPIVSNDMLEAEKEFQKAMEEKAMAHTYKEIKQQPPNNSVVIEERVDPQQKEEEQAESSYNIFCMKCKKKHPHNNVTASEVIIKKVKLNGYCGKCNSTNDMFIGEVIDG